ncbi:MAG: hypothetical protein ACI8WL_001103 [Polaribacter sp.]
MSAIFGGFTKDPSLRPSKSWRYAGIAANSIVILNFALAFARIKHLKHSQ